LSKTLWPPPCGRGPKRKKPAPGVSGRASKVSRCCAYPVTPSGALVDRYDQPVRLTCVRKLKVVNKVCISVSPVRP